MVGSFYLNYYCLLFTVPPVVSCYCRGKGCQDGLCILDPSTNQSCHTTFSRVGSEVSRQRGCTTECTEHHQDKEIRKCCREDKCNNEDIPSVWPSPTISPSPSSSAVVTAATPTPPTNDCDCASPTADILTTEQPTDQRRPTHLICHCSGCRDGGKTCLAAVACASRVIETVRMAWCIQEDLICKNNSFQLSCCYEDYCNDPFRPISGPPCDDEDTESSGGCDFGKQFNTMHQLFVSIYTDWYSITGPITPSTASPTTTTSTSTVSSEATPTSTTKATPTESITEDKDTETQYDNSEMMMIFYFFTIILSLIVITMIIVVVVCVVMLCHYRGMAYKTVLSSSTILESAMKEKGSPITNSSPV